MKIPLLVQVAVAHLASHVHIMTVPALLPLLPQALGMNFLELGAAISVFSIVSAVVQAPLGFVVDRYGARRLLALGLTLGSCTFLGLAVVGNPATLMIAMVLTGLANGVYHPADYALLSRGVSEGRMGRAFSVHTFAGYLGAALAPGLLLGTAYWLDSVSAAFALSGIIGLLALLPLLLASPAGARTQRRSVAARQAPAAAARRPTAAVRVLTPGVMLLTVLFVLLSVSTGGLERFSVSALINAYDTPLGTANAGLTAYLFLSALGVLAGGLLADRTQRHDAVAMGAFVLAAMLTAGLAMAQLPGVAMVVLLGMVGFLVGVVAPSRDMLVRASAPPEAQGRVFGIVSTGFNIGAAVGPVCFGWMLDRGYPEGVFWLTAAFMVVTVLMIAVQHALTTRWEGAARSAHQGGGA